MPNLRRIRCMPVALKRPESQDDHLPHLATEFRVHGAIPLLTHKPSSSTTLPFKLSPNSAAFQNSIK